jgi:RNA polymerase sigma factor for flagellar operon FliA
MGNISLDIQSFNFVLTILLAPFGLIVSMSVGQRPECPKCDSAPDGNEQHRQNVLREHLPLVRHIARRLHEKLPRHVPIDDLVNAGVVGLMDAFRKFNTDKHVQFGSYAKFRIRGAILDNLRELDWGPRDLRRQSRQIEEAHNKLQCELGRSPTEPELAFELRLTLTEIRKLLRDIDALEICSVRFMSADGGTEIDITEHLSGSNQDNPLLQCLNSEKKHLIAQAISELPEKEGTVVKLYYFEELTMKEVGIALGIGESRVSQIHSMAVTRLKARMAQSAGRAQLKARAAASGQSS